MTNKTQRTIIAFCESRETLNNADEMDLIQILEEQDKACSKGGRDFIYLRTLEGFEEIQNSVTTQSQKYISTLHIIKFITYEAHTTVTYSQ